MVTSMEHDEGNRNYEVIIIAAGCSRRLSHLTREQPKSFLSVGGRRVIERNLDTLNALGFEQVTIVVGYLKREFYTHIGNRYKKLDIRYVESLDYETTGHGWSVFQVRDAWRLHRRPIVLVHADIVYEPQILIDVMQTSAPNVISVDNQFESFTNDEVLVCGNAERVTHIATIDSSPVAIMGEVVGINKWSASFVDRLFAFMEEFFDEHGTNHNWEPVVDAFLASGAAVCSPLVPRTTDGRRWVNINYEEDLQRAADIVAAT